MDKLVKKLASSNKRKRRWIYICIVLGCFMAIALLQFYNISYPFWDRIIREAIWAIFSAVFVLAFVDFLKEEVEEEARQTEYMKMITDAITLNDSFIRGLNKESINKLLKASISHYADNIASSFVDYIKNHSNIYRSNFEYKVALSSNKEGRTEITHDIRYRKHFKVLKNEEQYMLKVYFAIRNGGLETVMGDDSIFFREELLYEPFLNKVCDVINNTDFDDEMKKKELIKLLGLAFTIYDNTSSEYPIDDDQIDISVSPDGIMFTYNIDNSFINESTTSINETYINYEAKIDCAYETNRENQFYCMFPNPTIESRFEMRFDKDIVSDIKRDVNYITMLSIDDDKDCKINTNSKQRIIEFKTTKTIFPRSGILVQWNK